MGDWSRHKGYYGADKNESADMTLKTRREISRDDRGLNERQEKTKVRRKLRIRPARRKSGHFTHHL